MNDQITVGLLGTGATLTMDIWGIARQPLLGIVAPDYSVVGRWVGHMWQGQFRHAAISKSPPVRGERVLGWAVHYVTGMMFAAVLLIGPHCPQPARGTSSRCATAVARQQFTADLSCARYAGPDHYHYRVPGQ